jgi:hypothetical protein
VADRPEEPRRSYAVSPAYQASWQRRGVTSLVVGAVLFVVGVLGVVVGVGSAALALLIGLVVGGVGLVINAGVRSTRRHRYSLAIASDRLIVTWRDQVTELPWADLDHALVVANGPLLRTLEVQPRPGDRFVLPRNARPRQSRRRPDNLDVFILTILGEQQTDCVADIAGHVPVQ